MIVLEEDGAYRNAYIVLFEILKGTDYLGNGRIILKCITKKQGVMAWSVFIWVRVGPRGGCWEYRNEPSGYVKDKEFLD